MDGSAGQSIYSVACLYLPLIPVFFPGATMTQDLVMRAAEAAGPFDRVGWFFEPKLDGYRGMIRRKDGKVSIHTKSGMNVTESYPTIAAAARMLPGGDFFLDGELVVTDAAGRSRLDLMRKKGSGPRIYWAFDLLERDGEDLRSLPLYERKIRLEEFLTGANFPVSSDKVIRYVWHVEERGVELFEKVCALGMEGVVAKRADAPYRIGRSRDWVKVPCYLTLHCVIVGISLRSRELYLAVSSEEGKLVYVGRVRHRVPVGRLESLREGIEAIASEIAVCPVVGDSHNVRWLLPKIGCRVRTKSSYVSTGKLRDPVFAGFEDLP